MDEFMREIYVLFYRRWIINRVRQMPLKNFEEKKDQIIFDTEKVFSNVIFNDNEIVELSCMNKAKGEAEFYLHFQMNQMEHAISLFEEMLACIEEIENKPVFKVLLCCTGGLTTSFFAYQLNEAIQSKKLEIEVSATEYGHVFEVAYKYDMILLAPQIAYKYVEAKNALQDKIVMKIPPRDYAKNSVDLILNQICDAFNQIYHPSAKPKIKQIHLGKDGQYLCLSIFQTYYKNHIHYRVYNYQREVVFEHEILKETINIEDIYGVIDSVISNSPIDTIGISLPGIVKDGNVSSSFIGGINGDAKETIEKKYQKKVILINDVNAAAVGFHQRHPEFGTFAYLFQPIGISAGLALFVNHQLIDGKYGLAGEIKLLPLDLSMPMNVLTLTPEGIEEVISKIVITVSAITSPEAFVISCDLVNDVSVLKEKVKEKFKEHIPNYELEIWKSVNLQEDILNGISILCM